MRERTGDGGGGGYSPSTFSCGGLSPLTNLVISISEIWSVGFNEIYDIQKMTY